MNHQNAASTGGLTVGRLAVPVAIALILTAGCATTQQTNKQQSELIAERLDNYVVEDGTVRHDVTNAEVAQLWQEFSALRRGGDLTAAKGKLETAISISPNDPALWSSAAELELEEESHLRAENFAAKSNSLTAVGNRPLRYRNWLIIERAREGRGDLLGAREAGIQSSKFK